MAGILEDLMPAVFTKLSTANDFDTAMGGRVFMEEYQTTDGTNPKTYPYAVFFPPYDISSHTFTSELSDVEIQVSIYDKASSPLTMLTYITKLHALLDDTTLTISNWYFVRMDRTNHIPVPRDDDGVRASHSMYKIVTQKM